MFIHACRRFEGTEATKAFDFVGHSTYAHTLMAPYQIGVLAEVGGVFIASLGARAYVFL